MEQNFLCMCWWTSGHPRQIFLENIYVRDIELAVDLTEYKNMKAPMLKDLAS